MKSPVIVFDFDKTLTDIDTIFGYYLCVNEKKRSFFLKRVLLLICGLLYKMRIIDNDNLKQCGVKLFLLGYSKKLLEEKAQSYAEVIKLNSIYDQVFLKTPKQNRVILSASFEIYLNQLFPREKVIGSKLDYNKKNEVVGLKKNMFGEAKKKYLENLGITSIDCLYTDSKSDLPLMDISNKVFLVQKGSIVNIK